MEGLGRWVRGREWGKVGIGVSEDVQKMSVDGGI